MHVLNVPCVGCTDVVEDAGRFILEDDVPFILYDAGRFICTDVEDDAVRFMARVYVLQQESVGTQWKMSQSNATETHTLLTTKTIMP